MLVIRRFFTLCWKKRDIFQHWLGGMGDTWYSSSDPTTFSRDCGFSVPKDSVPVTYRVFHIWYKQNRRVTILLRSLCSCKWLYLKEVSESFHLLRHRKTLLVVNMKNRFLSILFALRCETSKDFMWSMSLQLFHVRIPYVMDRKTIFQYRSSAAVLPRNKLFLNRFSLKTKRLLQASYPLY